MSIKCKHPEIPTKLPPCGGAKYKCGIKILRFSTNKSLYLANDKDSAIVNMKSE